MNQLYTALIGAGICVCVLSGCDYRDKTASPSKDQMQSSVETSKAKPMTLDNRQSFDAMPAATHGDQLNESIRNLADARAGKDMFQVIKAMNDLMARWTPTGRTDDEVAAVLGVPDMYALNNMVYRCDTGRGGWEWTLILENKRVVKVIKDSLD